LAAAQIETERQPYSYSPELLGRWQQAIAPPVAHDGLVALVPHVIVGPAHFPAPSQISATSLNPGSLDVAVPQGVRAGFGRQAPEVGAHD
jgi:hypothetical protein